ncbi:MAG: hypothetical protein ACREND_03870 [Gemmatimonadaceae bacterium]
MIDSVDDQPIVPSFLENDRPSFLASHRALAICSRELARLAVDVVRAAGALCGSGVDDKPVERVSPGRCIVQLGPVALTLTWLRSTIDTVADGDLLVIGWRGSVAPRGEHLPERMTERASPLAPVALWEDVFSAAGTDEASWIWRLKNSGTGGYSSTELADLSVERLRLAYENCRAAEKRIA